MEQYFKQESDANRAFLYGDAVSAFFFMRGGELIMAEESYFFLMASMRKMRLNIPLSYTLEFFQDLLSDFMKKQQASEGIIRFMAYRDGGKKTLAKSGVLYYCELAEYGDPLKLKEPAMLDIIKEIHVSTHLLGNIRVHSPENIYAEIYAKDNDLDDVILLNHQKRIARSIVGNLLFLEGKTIKTPKYSEGALISPMMENFVTFLDRNKLAEISETELIAFESQKADEILIVSDSHGIFPVKSIRNKEFGNAVFRDLVSAWSVSFNQINSEH